MRNSTCLPHPLSHPEHRPTQEGDVIILRARLTDDWLEGCIDNRVGMFPASFVVTSGQQQEAASRDAAAGALTRAPSKPVKPQKPMKPGDAALKRLPSKPPKPNVSRPS